MTKHIPVPEELLEEAVKVICDVSADICSPQTELLEEKIRALLDGPGVEPVTECAKCPFSSCSAGGSHYRNLLAAAPQHPATTDKENVE